MAVGDVQPSTYQAKQEPTTTHTGPTARMQCMNVWGGSGVADTAVSTTGVDVWLYSKPFGNLEEGGDVYYLSSCSSGRITRLVLADVSGHGHSVVELARRLRRLMGRHIDHIKQGALVRSINREFVSIGDAGTFATGLIATYFVPTGTLTITNAGHPSPLLYCAKRGGWRTVDVPSTTDRVSDVPLGMFESARYSQAEIKMTTDDLLLFFTDGLDESVDERGASLGRQGVLELAQGLGVPTPERVIPELLHRVMAMSETNLSGDDVSLMLIRPNGASVSARDNLLAPFRYLSNLFGRKV